jgi:hypothetical protein
MIERIDKFFGKLACELLVLVKTFYRNFVTDQLLNEEEGGVKKPLAMPIPIHDKKILEDSSSDSDRDNDDILDTDIERRMGNSWEYNRDSEFYGDFFDIKNPEETMVLALNTNAQKKKKRKRKGKDKKNKGPQSIPDIATNDHSPINDQAAKSLDEEQKIKEEIKKREEKPKEEQKHVNNNLVIAKTKKQKKNKVITREEPEDAKIVEQINMLNIESSDLKTQAKEIAKARKEYQNIKAQALEIFSAATSSQSKPKKSPKKKKTKAAKQDEELSQPPKEEKKSLKESPKESEDDKSESQSSSNTPIKTAEINTKEASAPLNSDQNCKGRWRKYSDDPKKKYYWKSPKEEVVYRKKGQADTNPNANLSCLPQPLINPAQVQVQNMASQLPYGYYYNAMQPQNSKAEMLESLNKEIMDFVEKNTLNNYSMYTISEAIRQKIEKLALETFNSMTIIITLICANRIQ